MNTDIRNGLGTLCLAAVLGLGWLAWSPGEGADATAYDAGITLGDGALLFAFIGLVLVMKGLFGGRR